MPGKKPLTANTAVVPFSPSAPILTGTAQAKDFADAAKKYEDGVKDGDWDEEAWELAERWFDWVGDGISAVKLHDDLKEAPTHLP